jgi:hypothetical protein
MATFPRAPLTATSARRRAAYVVVAAFAHGRALVWPGRGEGESAEDVRALAQASGSHRMT